MFDEMSVLVDLCFNQAFVLRVLRILEDNIANHNLIFMAHSLCRKWKQPVAYYLHMESLKQRWQHFLSAIFDTCQNGGWQVVATVCDMGANSVKALKLLETSFSSLSLQNYSTIDL